MRWLLLGSLIVVACGSEPGPSRTPRAALDRLIAAIHRPDVGTADWVFARSGLLRALFDCPEGSDNFVRQADAMHEGLAVNSLTKIEYDGDAGRQILQTGDVFRGCNTTHPVAVHTYRVTVTRKQGSDGKPQDIAGTVDVIEIDGTWYSLPIAIEHSDS